MFQRQLVKYVVQRIEATGMRKVLEETQTLHAGCSKAEPKNFCPAADPLPGVAKRPKFNQLERWSLPLPYKPNLVRIDARNFELSW